MNNLKDQLEKDLSEKDIDNILEDSEITPSEKSSAEANKLADKAHIVDQTEEPEGKVEPKGDGEIDFKGEDIKKADEDNDESSETKEQLEVSDGKVEPGLNESDEEDEKEVEVEVNVEVEDDDKDDESDEDSEDSEEDSDEDLKESFNKLWDLFGLNEEDNSVEMDEVPEGKPEPKGDGEIDQDNSDIKDPEDEEDTDLDKEVVSESEAIQGVESDAKKMEAQASDTAAPGAGDTKPEDVSGEVENNITVDDAIDKAKEVESENGKEETTKQAEVGSGDEGQKVDEKGQLVDADGKVGESVVGEGSKLQEEEEPKEPAQPEEDEEEVEIEGSKEDEEDSEDTKELTESDDEDESEEDSEDKDDESDEDEDLNEEGKKELPDALKKNMKDDADDDDTVPEALEDGSDDEDHDEKSDDDKENMVNPSEDKDADENLKESDEDESEEDSEDKDDESDDEEEKPTIEPAENIVDEKGQLKEDVGYSSVHELLLVESEYFEEDTYKVLTPEYKKERLEEQVALLIAREENDYRYEKLLEASNLVKLVKEDLLKEYKNKACDRTKNIMEMLQKDPETPEEGEKNELPEGEQKVDLSE
jgi:hypothetical protein